MDIRKAAVNGRFYPDSKEEIENLITLLLTKEEGNINTSLSEKHILGGIVPHAGYLFSGYQAIHFFKIIEKIDNFDTIVILNPNHTGYGKEISVDNHDFWETPLGLVENDLEFISKLNLPIDRTAHNYEHSGEVMLPFLQYFLEYSFKIVPITIGVQSYENSKLIAERIKSVENELQRKVLIIASSDFSHYVAPELGYQLDEKVVSQILDFQTENIEKIVKKNNLSICGYAPIMTLLEYSNLSSTNPKIKILKRGHSGEVIDSPEVVDYISMLIYEN